MPRILPSRATTLRLLSVSAAALLALTACSSSGSSGGSASSNSSDSSSSSPAPASTSATGTTSAGGPQVSALKQHLGSFSHLVSQYPTITPVSGTAALKTVKGKTVWWVPIGSAPTFDAFGQAMTKAFSALGISLHTCDGKFLPTTVAGCLSQAATQHAAGVVTGYVDYKMVPAAFDALTTAKIPVLLVGATNDSGKSATATFGFSDTTPIVEAGQRLAMESVIVDSGGKANILYLGVADSPQTKQGASYAQKFVKDNCPGCTFTEIDYNTASLLKVPSQISAALNSHPNTNYVAAEFDVAAPQTLNGIQTAGYGKKVKFVSVNGSLDSLQRLKAANTPQITDVGYSSEYLGWQFADGMVRMLAGTAPVSYSYGVFRVFTKNNVTGLKLTPAVSGTNEWYGTGNFKSTFLKAWGA